METNDLPFPSPLLGKLSGLSNPCMRAHFDSEAHVPGQADTDLHAVHIHVVNVLVYFLLHVPSLKVLTRSNCTIHFRSKERCT